MKTPIKFLTLVALFAGFATFAIATNTDDSTVTITFSEIAELAVSGDPGTLTITAPSTPGSLPDDETDATTTMAWTANVTAGTKKITGKIASLFSGIDLYATVAVAGSCGTSAGEQKLIETDTDFVTGITNCNTGTPGGTITFRADVTSMVAPDTYVRVVTWTLTAA